MASQITLRGNVLRKFLDTNILVYTDDPRDSAKQSRALEVVKDHLRLRTGVISLQVLQEYFSTVTGKLKMDPYLAKQRVESFAKMQVVEPIIGDILNAIDFHQLHRISYWDALILYSARLAGCRELLTEDMQHGQIIGGVRIVNPFI
ncbi:MAG: PIN domain-containing protein [Terracidiphilus sp.]